MKVISVLFLVIVVAVACSRSDEYETIGSIEAIDPSFSELISPDARVEVLANSFEWAEGPVWVPSLKALLFSDIPNNVVMKWSEQDGLQDYLMPAGFTGTNSKSPEPGSNGLLLGSDGHLILCQHGDRRIAMMDAPIDNPSPVFKTIVDSYQDKRLNSPNDATINKAGEIYFTDPPYGLPSQRDDDPEKELAINGVYKIKSDGTLLLLVDSITRPNGIGLSPDEKYLYIANSDPANARWYRYEVAGDSLVNGKVFYDLSDEDLKDVTGSPDGLKVDSRGNLFATGPGGVWIFSPEGKLLGRVLLPQATANCAFSPDENTLYLTADSYLLRLRMHNL